MTLSNTSFTSCWLYIPFATHQNHGIKRNVFFKLMARSPASLGDDNGGAWLGMGGKEGQDGEGGGAAGAAVVAAGGGELILKR